MCVCRYAYVGFIAPSRSRSLSHRFLLISCEQQNALAKICHCRFNVSIVVATSFICFCLKADDNVKCEKLHWQAANRWYYCCYCIHFRLKLRAAHPEVVHNWKITTVKVLFTFFFFAGAKVKFKVDIVQNRLFISVVFVNCSFLFFAVDFIYCATLTVTVWFIPLNGFGLKWIITSQSRHFVSLSTIHSWIAPEFNCTISFFVIHAFIFRLIFTVQKFSTWHLSNFCQFDVTNLVLFELGIESAVVGWNGQITIERCDIAKHLKHTKNGKWFVSFIAFIRRIIQVYVYKIIYNAITTWYKTQNLEI